jgi:dipeptidase E
MKLLLTSSGISNASIEAALVELLGKPIEDSSALIVPTAINPFPEGAGGAWRAISGRTESPFSGLGWKSLGVLELTALPSIKEESWIPGLRETDAPLVWGGHVMYLCHWLRRSGLAELLPSLSKTVYVGVSAGSIAMTPHNPDVEFNRQWLPAGSDVAREGDKGLGLVDFAVTVHVGREGFNTSDDVERWASGIPVPTYALDDQSAVTVTDGYVEVVSEGSWRPFNPARSE